MRILFLLFFGYLVNYFYLSNDNTIMEITNTIRGFMVLGFIMALVQDISEVVRTFKKVER